MLILQVKHYRIKNVHIKKYILNKWGGRKKENSISSQSELSLVKMS